MQDMLLKQVIHSVGNGIVVYDTGLICKVWNQFMEQLTGIGASDIIGTSPLDQFYFLREYGVVDSIRSVLNGGDSEEIEFPYEIASTGKKGWVSDTNWPLLDDAGNITGVVGIVKEITKEKNATKALEESELRFRTLFQNAPLGYQSLDENGNFIEVNDTWCRTLGYEREEIIGKNFSELIHPDFSEAFKENFPRFKGLGYIVGVEFEMKKKNGEMILVNFDGRIGKNEDGSFKQTHCVFRDITSQKIAEEALIESEASLRSLVSAIPDIVIRFSSESRCLFVSDNASDIFGNQSSELIGNSIYDFGLPLREARDLDDSIKTVSRTDTTYEKEVIYDSEKGHKVLNWRLFPDKKDDDGSRVVLSIVRDITTHRKVEEDYENLFRKMLDGFALHEIILDDEGAPIDYRFISVNPAFEYLTGLKARDVEGKTVLEVMPNTEKYWIESYGRVALTGEPVVFENYSKELDKHFEISAYRPAPNQFACIFSDVTVRKKAELALRRNEALLRNIIDSSRDYIFVKDRNLRTLLCNKIFAEAMGKTAEEMIGKTDIENGWDPELVKGNPDKGITGYEHFDLKALAGEVIHVTDEKAKVVDGDKAFDTIKLPLKDENDNIIGILGFSRDITEQLRDRKEKENLQGQLFQSQKLEAVGQLAGGVAHDFNNMLGVILSAAEIAYMDIDSESNVREEIRTIIEAVEKARSLTMKLLTFARRDRIDVKGIPAGKIIRNLYDMISRTVPKKVDIEVNVIDNCLILCDQNQIHQALLNVCNNAVDAMPDGGKLKIEVREIEMPEGRCSHCGEQLEGSYCSIEIVDTGIGMTADIVKKITEPFFTTKGIGKGTGLGLSVTHGIVKTHEGHLHIYSEPGRGTSVRIYMPLDTANPVDERKPREELQLEGEETILVVDDEVVLLQVAGKLLSRKGYNPILASSGEEAIKVFRENNNKISAVVLDIMMPEMDGREVERKLMKINPEIPIIFSSGFSDDGMAEELLSNSRHRFVQKPFDVKTLCSVIRILLDKKD